MAAPTTIPIISLGRTSGTSLNAMIVMTTPKPVTSAALSECSVSCGRFVQMVARSTVWLRKASSEPELSTCLVAHSVNAVMSADGAASRVLARLL